MKLLLQQSMHEMTS